MQSIRNINVNHFDLDSNVLATSGIATCIAAIVQLENTIFIYHVDVSTFNVSHKCLMNDGDEFLMEIFKKVLEKDEKPIFKSIYLIGGLNNDEYSAFKNQIDKIREHHSMITNKRETVPHDNYHLFILAIKLNLIDFNLPPMTPRGEKKTVYENDDPYDYVIDCTIVYDRTINPHRFLVYHFGGREFEMGSNRSESLLLAIYNVDTISFDINGLFRANATNSPYHSKFLNQILHNVKKPSHLHQSIDNNTIKEQLNILSKVESTPLVNDDNDDDDD